MAAATVLSLGLAGSAAWAATALAAEHDTYEWSAQLVSFDEASATAVVQARVEGHARIEDLDRFADGDRLTLVWTGRTWAAGIRDLARNPELTPQTLSLPVEFVSTERNGEYINFRVKVPATAIDAIAAMEPGVRITGVSPKQAAGFDGAVISMRHYNDIG